MFMRLFRLAILGTLAVNFWGWRLSAQEKQPVPAGESATKDSGGGRDSAVEPTPRKTTRSTVAQLTVKGSFPESAGQTGLFGELELNLAEFVARLERTVNDKAVTEVVLRIRDPDIGPGKVRELRDAVERVRRGGKRVTALLESASTPDYLVACACDEIVMPESGTIMIPGVRAELMFYKGLFDLAGIEADMLQVGDFKGAAEPYTRREMSPDFRRQYESVLDDLFDQIVTKRCGSWSMSACSCPRRRTLRG
jgi:protease-4